MSPKLLAKSEQINFKSGFRPGYNYEADLIFDAKKASDVTGAMVHTEASASVLVAGGQVSFNKDSDVRGVGLKLGPGLGVGFNINKPLFGWSSN